MELSEEQICKFAELERCYCQYFDVSLAPVMEQVRKEVSDRQLEEMKEHSTSFAGIISMASSPMGGPSGNSIEMITRTGVWSRLKAEDYIALCQERIGKSEQIAADLGVIANDWRNELVGAVGQEQYDSMSRALGTDVAYAYTGYRMEQLMIDRLVRQNMPKSSLDYIMKTAAESSLLGLPALLQRSPLDKEIAEASKKAYAPSMLEKGTGKVLSFGMDTVTTCGFSSWANLGKLALFEVASEGASAIYDATRKKDEIPNVEQLISQGVFGSERNILETFRKESKRINPHENLYIRELDGKMKGRMRLVPEENLAWMNEIGWHPEELKLDFEEQMKKEYSDIPSVVLPGNEEAYLAMKQEGNIVLNQNNDNSCVESDDKVDEKAVEKVVGASASNQLSGNNESPGKVKEIDGLEVVPISESKQSSGEASLVEQNGWGGLLGSVGLSDVGSVGRNLGYVVAMLPDLLVGLFTGKTKSLKLMDNLFPIASIMMGLFSRNPLVKMLLVGLGGMNLLNKAGHESLEKQNSTSVQTAGKEKREYKIYADEPLNPRVSNPEIKGDYLLATVDKVPCSILLPKTAVAAYQSGALPLNTLVNAILTKSDELRAMAQENYEATELRNVQARGIG